MSKTVEIGGFHAAVSVFEGKLSRTDHRLLWKRRQILKLRLQLSTAAVAKKDFWLFLLNFRRFGSLYLKIG